MYQQWQLPTNPKLIFQISVLKKSIAKHESDFEAENGRAMTPGERIIDLQLTRMYENLRRFQAEKRCIKTDPAEYALKLQAARQQKERDERLDEALRSEKSMVEVIRDIEEVRLAKSFLPFKLISVAKSPVM